MWAGCYLEDIIRDYDGVYISIVHTDKARIEGETLGCYFLGAAARRRHNEYPTLGPRLVIGGGNVAVDVTRTSIAWALRGLLRIQAQAGDMTPGGRVEGAIAEGAELLTLKAPPALKDKDSGAVALWVKPQLSAADSSGRPSPANSSLPEERMAADLT